MLSRSTGMYFIYYLLFSSTPLAARISSSQPVSSPFFFFSPSNFFFPPPNIFFSFKTFPGQFVLARFLYSYYFKGRTWIPSTSFQGQEDGMRVINNRTVSKESTILNIWRLLSKANKVTLVELRLMYIYVLLLWLIGWCIKDFWTYLGHITSFGTLILIYIAVRWNYKKYENDFSLAPTI